MSQPETFVRSQEGRYKIEVSCAKGGIGLTPFATLMRLALVVVRYACRTAIILRFDVTIKPPAFDSDRTMMTAWSRIRDALTRLLCVVALLLVSLSHAPPGASAALGPAAAVLGSGTVVEISPIAAEANAYTLPDGTVPDLCLVKKDKARHQSRSLGIGCEACRLSLDIALPAPPDSACGNRSKPGTRLPVFTDSVIPPRLFLPNAAPRAPPLPAVL
ncbi:hypothetical protein [Rhizobium sp. SSA_523]|uniref:hypothetical protein n=1 Tax=Rhizobium sp. SSA_523 TaxID=2952477 RepID=UPI002090A4BB|nr:hypothetical protein [Rhizobium sp. SSA_523]MCO5731145.1 hypothetical protein [Rhizobium sp. SSA_523]WKC22309.1 hypothetical protein QTJ18_03990 [Rhizobium sp. SSA_523]